MNRLSLRNYQLKIKTSGELPIISEEIGEYASNYDEEKPEDVNMSPWLDLETLGYRPVMPTNLQGHCSSADSIFFQQLLFSISLHLKPFTVLQLQSSKT